MAYLTAPIQSIAARHLRFFIQKTAQGAFQRINIYLGELRVTALWSLDDDNLCHDSRVYIGSITSQPLLKLSDLRKRSK